MLSSILSVILGYVAMAIVVMVGSMLAAATLIPGGLSAARKMERPPTTAYLYANLALSFVAALLGGWVCANRAPASPMLHVAVLALFLLVMSFLSARSYSARQPLWYKRTIGMVGVTGVILGGVWRVLSAGA